MNITIKTIVQTATGWHLDDFSVQKRLPLPIQSNDLYDVKKGEQHLILKAYLKPQEQAVAPLREFRALSLLEPLDVAPKPLFYQPDVGPFVLYEYLEGVMWDRQRPSPAQLKSLAESWILINAVSSEKTWPSRGAEFPVRFDSAAVWFDAYVAWAETAVSPNRALIDQVAVHLKSKEVLFQKLKEATFDRCFSRADPRFANFIQRPDGRLGFVDWEDSGWHDPALAVADLMTHPNQEDLLRWEAWQPFLMPTFAHWQKRDPQFKERFGWYTAVLPLWWLTLFLKVSINHHRQNSYDSWLINDLPAEQRLSNYLAWLESWPNRANF